MHFILSAFYIKQVFYTFSVPMLIMGSFLSWCFIYVVCARRWKLKWVNVKHRIVLTMTLMIFLCYPMLVKLCLGMLKCILIGDQRYLMADLQERCFEGRHLMYIMLFTVPQLILYIIGLPLFATILILRNIKNLNDPDFRMRYGLLYRGYTEGREWWEVTVAFRKVAAASIGTFGSMIGIPEVQVGLALFIGLISLVMHLVGQPFGDPNGKSKQLHQMELFSLIVIWFTNWGGLMLFVDTTPSSKIVLTIFIILMVSSYNIVAIYVFGKAIISAAIKKRKERLSILNGDTVINDPNNTQIVPVEIKTMEEEEEDNVQSDQSTHQSDFNNFSTTATTTTTTRRSSIARIRSDRSQIVHNIEQEHRLSQLGLDANLEMRGRKQRRKTQLRVKARAKLKQQKTLSKIPAFAKLTEEERDAMIEVMEPERHVMGTELCKQGDIALKFYVVMSGKCTAYVKKDGTIKNVGTISTFQFFGESSLLSEPDVNDTRNASVEVESEFCSLLVLTKSKFYGLIEQGVLNRDVLDGVKKVDSARQEQNMEV